MKRIFALLTAALLLLLCGCGPSKNQYKATYLYTGYDSTAPDNQVWVLHSMAELEDYAAGADKRVAEALSSYDEAFFKSHVLFVLKFSMASSAYRYVVERVYETEEGLTFQLKQTVQGGVPAVVGGMTILVEMDKSWDCKAENITIDMQ